MGSDSMKPHYLGHRKRLRERFQKTGLASFQDYEAVELLLTLAIPRKDVKNAAKEAIKKFGSFRGVLDAPVEELKKLPGVGEVAPLAIRFIREAPGLHEECSRLISELQCIPETNLYPRKCFCDIRDPKMNRPIQLCDKAFHAVIGHIAQFPPEVDISNESLEWYEFFRELVNEEISKVISS